MSENKAEGKSGKGLKIVIIILILIIVCAGAFIAYTMIAKKNPSNTKPVQNVSKSTVVDGNKNEVAPIVSEITYDMGDFLANLADQEGKRFVKAKIFLGYGNKKLTEELEGKKPIIRDAINTVLRSKKVKDISDEKGLQKVKKDILQKINIMLEQGRCESVYFNEIIIQ